MKLRLILAFILFINTLFVMGAESPVVQSNVIPSLYQTVDSLSMREWVDSVYNNMSTDDRIGQLFIAVVSAKDNEANRAIIDSYVKKQHIGGLLFSKGTPMGQANLTNRANFESKVPLLITCDGEWGLAMRLDSTLSYPKNMMLAATNDDSLIYEYGKEIGQQCKRLEINVNFAPDMDINTNPDNPVIGTRSFGEIPCQISKLGLAYARGLESENIMAVAKHFPGHGNTSTDSHKQLPIITLSRDSLEKNELIPFQKYIKAGLSGMMIGHLYVPALDSIKQPSSLSYNIVTKLLHQRMGFTGLTFTDGLLMRGVSSEPNYCLRALLAGNDMLLGPAHLKTEFENMKLARESGHITDSLIEVKCKKILEYKYILNVSRNAIIDTTNLIKNLNTPAAKSLDRELYKKAITLLKNTNHLVPLKELDNKNIACISIGTLKGNSFQNVLNQYAHVSCYSALTPSDLEALKSKLALYNTIILSVHTRKYASQFNQIIGDILQNKSSVIAFFTTPYLMSQYKKSIQAAGSVFLGYEDSNCSREYVAQDIFGGNDVEGKLPVTVNELFNRGDGLSEVKVRLGYGMPEQVGLSSNKLSHISDIVNEGINAEAFPGCQVLVAKDGVVIYNRSFGTFSYGGNHTVDNNDLFDLASMTKASATLLAVMNLYEKKKIRLNMNISRFVKPLRKTNKSRITISQALFHESGLPAFIPYYLYAIDKHSYGNRLFSCHPDSIFATRIDTHTWARTDYKYKSDLISFTPKSDFLPIADSLYVDKTYSDTILAAIAKCRLLKRRTYLYSCLNFILLEKVVENITRTDLNTYVQNQFFKKLGAYTTTFNPLTKFSKQNIAPTEKDNFLRRQLIQGYVQDEAAAFKGGISGNAGLFSDANDLAKIYQMLLNNGIYGGERYFSKKTSLLFTGTKSGISRRGLGFDKPETRVNKPNPCSPSTPPSVYGHTGFTGTCFWVDPDSKMIYIFLSNRIYESRLHNEISNLAIRQRIQEQIYDAIKFSKNTRDSSFYKYSEIKHIWEKMGIE